MAFNLSMLVSCLIFLMSTSAYSRSRPTLHSAFLPASIRFKSSQLRSHALRLHTHRMSVDAAKKNTKTKDLMRQVEKDDESSNYLPDTGPIDLDESTPVAKTAALAGDERKAEDIVALRVSHVTCTTTFFVIMGAGSSVQVGAIAQNVKDKLKEVHDRDAHLQGDQNCGWILLDYGDVIVNVMSAEMREFYNLEGRWSEGEVLDLSNVVVTGPVVQETLLEDDDEDDPFWA